MRARVAAFRQPPHPPHPTPTPVSPLPLPTLTLNSAEELRMRARVAALKKSQLNLQQLIRGEQV
jgi:hypothetical protein